MKHGTYHNLSTFIDYHKSQGFHFFDANTMRCFKTNLLNGFYGKCVFVTSDADWNGNRIYSVRVALDSGSVYTYGKYGNAYDAKKDAKWLANGLVNGTIGTTPDGYDFAEISLDLSNQ